MKIKLLKNGGYTGLDKVIFPVEVEGTEVMSDSSVFGYDVSGAELIRIGGDPSCYSESNTYLFYTESEAKAV